MLDQGTPPPPIVAPAAPADAVPADLKAMLDIAMTEGDQATVDHMFDYARRARPDAAGAIDALRKSYQSRLAERREQQAVAERERLASASPFENWNGQVEFGASWSTGVASSLGLLASLDLERKGNLWTHKLLLRGEVQDTNGTRAVERVIASWQPRYALSERAYVFGLGQYEHDPALGYDNRYSAALGGGIQLGEPDRLRLAFEGGPAVRRTELDGERRTALAGRASADLKWALSPRLTFQQKIAAYYEGGEANGLITSALDTNVSARIKLRLSYEYRYENETTTQNSGSTSRASLVYSL